MNQRYSNSHFRVYRPHVFSPLSTPLEPQSRFGDKPLKFQVVCPQNGTAVLQGLTTVTNQVPLAITTVIFCAHVFPSILQSR